MNTEERLEKLERELACAKRVNRWLFAILFLAAGVYLLALIFVASNAAAQANTRSAIPAAESYYNDPAAGNNSYTGITGALVRVQAPGVDPAVKAGQNAAGDGYCVEDTASGATWHYSGGTGGTATITTGVCVAATYASVT